MATIINNPDSGSGNGGGAGMVIGAVIVLVIIVLFFIYGLPALRGSRSGTTIQVPDKINVNVSKPAGNGY